MAYKVMIDPGHGGRDSGAVGFGRTEKADVLQLGLRMSEILSANGVIVQMTRTTDIYETPTTKAREGNAFGADLFVSVHRNSAASSAANGFETLVYANKNKAKVIADQANAREGNAFGADLFVSVHRNSAASSAANGFETLVYANKNKAKVIADQANAKMQALGFRNRGTKIRKDLAVLNSTKMEAVLFEVGFISNELDNRLFNTRFEWIAQALCNSVLAALGMKPSETPSKPQKPTAPPKPQQTDRFIDVAYQVYANGRWLPVVHSMQDFAGIENVEIKGIRVWTVGKQKDVGNVRYRVHLKGRPKDEWLDWMVDRQKDKYGDDFAGIRVWTVGKQKDVGNVRYRVHLKGRPKDEWLDWMVDRQKDKYGDDFAGNLEDEIDCIQMELINCPGRKIQYRTSRTSDDNYYAFVTNCENEGGHAGVYGRAADKLQCRVA